MASGDRSTLTPAQKRRATILAEPIDPKPEDLPLQSPRKTTSASANSERMSLMLPSSPISSSTTRGASASIVEVANHNKRGSHERQMSGPESLSQLSRQVTRKNVNAKMDSSLLNIKAQLESGGSSPSTSEPGSPQQPKPQQQQHQQMFYEKEIDDNLLLFCRESLDTIIQGSGNVVYDDMSQINQLFKFDTGRRLFAFLLQYFSNRKEQQLQPEGFEVLLFLYNSCLNELAASDTNDWNTLSLLMDTSCLFFQRSHNGNKEYMKDILRTHFIWQNADYWESNFWSQFTADYRAAFGDAAGASSSSTNDAKSRLFIQNKKQKEWVMEQLKTFCATMSYWGMTQEQTRHFVATISNCTKYFATLLYFRLPSHLLCALCFSFQMLDWLRTAKKRFLSRLKRQRNPLRPSLRKRPNHLAVATKRNPNGSRCLAALYLHTQCIRYHHFFLNKTQHYSLYKG